MAIEIILSRDTGRSWSSSGNVRSKGFAFSPSGQLYQGEALATLVNSSDHSLPDLIGSLTGEFALIDLTPGRESAAVDPIRSMPLYFAESENGVLVSDDAHALATRLASVPADVNSQTEFLLQGHVTGSGTLARGVFQLLAGQVAVCVDAGIEIVDYHLPFGSDPGHDERDGADLLDEAVEIIRSAFERTARTLGDFQVAIPLSGGLDSRIAAGLLRNAGVSNLICYTYGRANSFESRTSRNVAERLDLPWHFVEYSERMWNGVFTSAEYQSFRRFGSDLVTIEHEQDWPAVDQLLDRGVLTEDSVVIPGHSGDFLAGSHLPAEAFRASGDPVEWVLQRYYNLWPRKSLDPGVVQALRDRIKSAMRGAGVVVGFDRYGLSERQSKMIVNSLRVYEHHGLDWRIPFWDRALIDFFGSLPLEWRHHKRLYLRAARALLGSAFDIDFVEPELSTAERLWRRATDRDYARYGLYAGPKPLVAALSKRIGDLIPAESPATNQVVGAMSAQPLQAAPINALTALLQLRDSLERLA